MQFNLKQNTPENETEWVQWSKPLNEEGHFEITPSKTLFKEENSLFILIDEEANVGITVFCTNHENSKFKSTPHGVRLANAIGRAFNLTGDVDAETLVDHMNTGVHTVRVEKTDKGVLWTVIQQA